MITDEREQDDGILTFIDSCRTHIEGRVTEQWQGAANMVFATDLGVVWRFPLRPLDAERLDTIADRHRVAHTKGLGAPRVVSVAGGPVGVAHLVLERLAGTPLLTAVARNQPTEPAVACALSRLRSTRAWPFEQISWPTLWADLVTRADANRSHLPDAERHIAAANVAATTAAEAPLGILHGDLGSDNLLIDDSGGFVGLLDWDGAVIGDPALDTVAVLHSLPAAESGRLRAEHEWIAADVARAEVYLATWELQDLLGRLLSDRSV